MWAEGGVFDTISFYWYGTFTLLVLICKKEKKKSKRINRTHAFDYFYHHLSKTLRSFQAIELGTMFHKLVQKSWC